jgi:hypothetical protein
MLVAVQRHMLLVLFVWIGVSLAGCTDRPLITFANHRDHHVAIHIDGDRVLILRPHTTEGLPYAVAAWTWPRHIEARDQFNHRILSFYAGAGDLALQHWRVDIR